MRQALAAFRGDSNKHSLPAANTITRCIAHIETASHGDSEVEVAELRKCLFALGLSPDDTAVLLDRLDRTNSGFVDGKVLSKTFLSSEARSFPSHDEENNNGGDARHTLVAGKAAAHSTATTTISTSEERAMKELHRKVIERVLLKSKTQNIKDAFRQYDFDRAGFLTLPQFRTLVRDHGFAGTEVERLIKYLDRSNQGTISFHVFSGDVKLGANQGYPKSSPKRQQQAPPLTKNGVSATSRAKVKSGAASQDPMESIRAKLRQRVMGHNKSIREVFMDFDDDENGYLDHDEFKRFMAKYNFTNDEACQVIDYLDRDCSGTIDYDEFSSGLLFYRPPAAPAVAPMASTHQVHGSQHKMSPAKAERVLHGVRQKLAEKLKSSQSSKSARTKLRDEFSKYDSENKNGLDYQEFGAFLVGMGVKLKSEELSALLACIDTDGSEIVEFEEFAKLQNSVFESDGEEDGTDGSSKNAIGNHPTKDDRLFAVFNKYDIDGSGFLDYEEFSELMRENGFSETDILHVIKQIDQKEPSVGSGSRNVKTRGKVDYRTFASVVNEGKWNIQDAKSPKKGQLSSTTSGPTQHLLWVTTVLQKHRSLEEAFRGHDTDGSGELDYEEFRRFMKRYGMKRDGEINALIDQMDSDGNGTISLAEFIRVFGREKVKVGTSKQSKQDAKVRLALLRDQELSWMQQALREYDSIEDAFRDVDRQHRDEVNYEQFRDLMGQYGIRGEEDISLLVKRLDVDNSGTIDLQEFLSVFNAQRLAQRKNADIKKSKQPLNATNSERREKAARLRRLEELWIRRVLESHGSIKACFEKFDGDNSGELDYDEFRQIMSSFGISDRGDIDMLVKRLDVDQSGAIDYDEFVTVFYEERVEKNGGSRRSSSVSPTATAAEAKKARIARQRELEVKWMKRVLACHQSIETAFNEYDEDGSGELDHDEFGRFMKRYGIVREEDISSLITRLDLDDSGAIDYEEFTSIFNPLRVAHGGNGSALAGMLSSVDEEPFDPDELESILEIERELAVRMLKNTRDLRVAFRKYDLNGNGRLEYKEFRQVLRAYRFPEMEIRRVIRHLDKSVSGFIDYKEFIAGFSITKENARGSPGETRKKTRYQVASVPRNRVAVHPTNRKSGSTVSVELPSDATERLKKELLARILATYGTVQSVFRRYDEGQDGRLTEQEFEALVTDHGLSRDDARLLLDAFDQDRSGSIEYEEFLSQLVARGAM